MASTFNADTPVEGQLTDYSCSVGAAFWCLRSIGMDISQQQLQDIMVGSLVSPDLGLLDGSGAGLAALLGQRWGLAAHSQSGVSFDDVAARAGKQPVAIGGAQWWNGIGHWVAVRGTDGTQLQLANPGGNGPHFGQQALDRDGFAARGPFAAVWIDVDSVAQAASPSAAGGGAIKEKEPQREVGKEKNAQR